MHGHEHSSAPAAHIILPVPPSSCSPWSVPLPRGPSNKPLRPPCQITISYFVPGQRNPKDSAQNEEDDKSGTIYRSTRLKVEVVRDQHVPSPYRVARTVPTRHESSSKNPTPHQRYPLLNARCASRLRVTYEQTPVTCCSRDVNVSLGNVCSQCAGVLVVRRLLSHESLEVRGCWRPLLVSNSHSLVHHDDVRDVQKHTHSCDATSLRTLKVPGTPRLNKDKQATRGTF